MHKTIQVHLGGSIFHLEEPAYQKLKTYLKTIEDHFSEQDNGKEIVGDIESGMAEHLSQKISRHKKVIVETEIDELIKTMGNIEDFETVDRPQNHQKNGGETDQEKTKQGAGKFFSGLSKRKLYRNPNEAMLGGVCAGLSAYSGLDVTIIRVIFVFLALTGGFGILLYLILWLVTPAAYTQAQKMEMYGEAVNLQTLSGKIKEPTPEEKFERQKMRDKWISVFLLIFTSLLFIPFLPFLYLTALVSTQGHPPLVAGFLSIIGLIGFSYTFYRLISNIVNPTKNLKGTNVIFPLLLIIFGIFFLTLTLVALYFVPSQTVSMLSGH